MADFNIDASTIRPTSIVYEGKGQGLQSGPARGAYEKAQKNLSRAHEEVDRLLQRVQPALAPEAPLPTSGESADAPDMGASEVTGSFLDIADRADRLARRISNITSRVDL